MANGLSDILQQLGVGVAAGGGFQPGVDPTTTLLGGLVSARQTREGQQAAQQQQQQLQEVLGGAGLPTLGGLAGTGQSFADIIKFQEQQRKGQATQRREALQERLISRAAPTDAVDGELEQRKNIARAQLLDPSTAAFGKSELDDIRIQEQEQRQIAREERALEREFEKQSRKAQTPENAAKISLVNRGLENIKAATKLFFDKKGDFLESIAIGAGAETGITAPIGTGIQAFSADARKARALILNATNAQLRAESGAAVPSEEVLRAAERFIPTALDNAETARLKLGELEKLLAGTKKLFQPQPARAVTEPAADLTTFSNADLDAEIAREQGL